MARVWSGEWAPQNSLQRLVSTRSTRGPRSSMNEIKRSLSRSAAFNAVF